MRCLTLIPFLLLGCGSAKPPHEGKSVEQLIELLRSSDTGSKIQGAIGLAKHGDQAAAAVPELLKLLASPEASIRENAVNALGRIGAKEAVPELLPLLSDATWTVRRHAVLALGEIGDPAALKPVEKLLKDPDGLVRKAAQETVKKLKKVRG
jgi:HEAT repeat protein